MQRSLEEFGLTNSKAPPDEVRQTVAIACSKEHCALETFSKPTILPLLSAAARDNIVSRRTTSEDISTLAALAKEAKREYLKVSFSSICTIIPGWRFLQAR